MCEQTKACGCCDLTLGILIFAVLVSIQLLAELPFALQLALMGAIAANMQFGPVGGVVFLLLALVIFAILVTRLVLLWIAFAKNSNTLTAANPHVGIHKESRKDLSCFYKTSFVVIVVLMVLSWPFIYFNPAIENAGVAILLMVMVHLVFIVVDGYYLSVIISWEA
jgi:hypothetical protein